MIWFRRLLTIPLILLFLTVFSGALLVSQVNSTWGNPKFYSDQMRRADIYNFVYDKAMPAELDEIDRTQDLPIDSSAARDELIPAARQILPSRWLQAQVESATAALVPYALGSTNKLAYTVTLKDRVEKAAEVIRDDLLEGNTATSLYEREMARLADKAAEGLDKWPYALSVSKQEIEDVLRTVAPKSWITSQAKAAINSVTPYMTGDSEHFAIKVDLKPRVDAALPAVIDLLDRQETYDYLFDEIVMPKIDEQLGKEVKLNFGPLEVTLFTGEEILPQVKEVLPHSWFRQRLKEAVGQLASYIKGERNTLAIVVPLADRKEATAEAIEKLIDRKLGIASKLVPGSIKREMIDSSIIDRIPNQWIYTEADLRQALGEENWNFIEKLRERVSSGWIFTEADLAGKMGGDKLDEVRDWIRQGYTLTETSLRNMAESAGVELSTVDTARHWMGVARAWAWALWLMSFILLGLVGFLGGRDWRNKLLWALALLFLISLAIYISAGPAYAHIGRPGVEKMLPAPAKYEGFLAVMVQKADEMITNMISAFVSGIKTKTLCMMIGSGTLLLGLATWNLIRPHEPTS